MNSRSQWEMDSQWQKDQGRIVWSFRSRRKGQCTWLSKTEWFWTWCLYQGGLASTWALGFGTSQRGPRKSPGIRSEQEWGGDLFLGWAISLLRPGGQEERKWMWAVMSGIQVNVSFETSKLCSGQTEIPVVKIVSAESLQNKTEKEALLWISVQRPPEQVLIMTMAVFTKWT